MSVHLATLLKMEALCCFVLAWYAALETLATINHAIMVTCPCLLKRWMRVITLLVAVHVVSAKLTTPFDAMTMGLVAEAFVFGLYFCGINLATYPVVKLKREGSTDYVCTHNPKAQ